MKKIFVGGFGACDVHNEKDMIYTLVEMRKDFEIVNSYKEADIIIIMDTCVGLEHYIHESFSYIEKVLIEKQSHASLIVSGCLTKDMKFQFDDKEQSILDKVTLVPPDEIVSYIAKIIKKDITKEQLDNISIHYTIRGYSIRFSPVIGCINHCSFCKSNYMNFNLQSTPIEKIQELSSWIEMLEDYPLHHFNIFSSNLSLYGLDLYGKRRAHEVIRELTKPEIIKFASVGAIINWYPELLNEILENQKIKEIYISIESGSPRIYKLMNRPISFEKLVEVIRTIRKNRPDIIIKTEFITGFPTETIDDLKRTIELAYELEVYPIDLHPYENSSYIPSSKLEQHSYSYGVKMKKYADLKLLQLYDKFVERIKNGEMFVAKKFKEDNIHLYSMLLVDGRRRIIDINQLDREYEIGEIILANVVKPKQLVKRK